VSVIVAGRICADQRGAVVGAAATEAGTPMKVNTSWFPVVVTV
jgi:hypothetical protein